LRDDNGKGLKAGAVPFYDHTEGSPFSNFNLILLFNFSPANYGTMQTIAYYYGTYRLPGLSGRYIHRDAFAFANGAKDKATLHYRESRGNRFRYQLFTACTDIGDFSGNQLAPSRMRDATDTRI